MESLTEYQASVAVWQYCSPLLFAFGTFGNSMTVVIIHRLKRRQCAMPLFLTALAVSDTCQLLTGLLRGWLIAVFQVDVRTLSSGVCKVHTWLVYSSILLSSWLLSYMTMERTVSVWFPHRVSLLCSRSKAVLVILVTAGMALVLNGHMLLWLEVMVVKNGTSRECFSPDRRYIAFIYEVWNWVDFTVASLLPFTCVLLGNVLIVWKVSLSVRIAKKLSSSRSQDMSHRQRKTSSMTVTLMTLSAIFFVTTSPICVYNLLEPHIMEAVQDSTRGKARMKLAWAVVNILMYTNSTVNFYLYCLSGAGFRRELKRCLCLHSKSTPSPSKNLDVATVTNNSQGHADCADSSLPLPSLHPGSVTSILDKGRRRGMCNGGLSGKARTNGCVLLSVKACETDFCSDFHGQS